MTQNIPDQAEKLRQLAALEHEAASISTNTTATIEEHPVDPVKPNGSKPSPSRSITIPLKPTLPESNVSKQENKPKTKHRSLKRNHSLPETRRSDPKSASGSLLESTRTARPDPSPESTIQTKTVQPRASLKPDTAHSSAGLVPSPPDTVRFPIERSTQVIAITGGKGGVGKTNVACNLAIAMAQMNKRVLLLDADLSLANVDVLLGMTPRHNLTHLIQGTKTLREIIVNGPAGIQIIPGGSGIEELSQLDTGEMRRLFDAFEGLNPAPDVFIIDTAAGIHKNVMQFLAAADQVIVVTTPEPTAYTDAYALIKILHKHSRDKEIGVLVNMAQNAREAFEVIRLMLNMCKQFLNRSFNNIGFIPRDPEILKAVRQQKPILTYSPSAIASKSIKTIAATILQVEYKEKQSRGLRHFLQKLFTHHESNAAVSSMEIM